MFKSTNFFIILFCLIIATSSANAATYFTANLNGAQEIPASSSSATGFGRIRLNDDENRVTVSLYFGSPVALIGTVTAGHIHSAGDANLNFPIIFDLNPPVGFTTGSVVNTEFKVTPAQVADLKAGLWFFNIHTNRFPDGEIRGQITVDSPFIANIDNNQVIPPTDAVGAKGRAIVSLNEATKQVLVTMNWSGLSGNPKTAQLFSGRVGTNGSPLCSLEPPALTEGSLVDYLCDLSSEQVKELKQVQLYLIIQTGANPNGEIRGQIQRRASTICDYDGDGVTDAAIVRQAFPNTEWWIRNSRDGSASVYTFGNYADFAAKKMVCGDFDGDGKDDLALWRSADTPNAFFYIFQSGDFTVREVQFGTTGDDPRIVEDYDGDGRTDIAVFRVSDGTWYFLPSANNPDRNVVSVRWGTAYANPGDFDGDGKADFVDHQGSSWWILNSSDLSYKVVSFGPNLVFGAPGDYDGDGKTDIAVVSIENHYKTWYFHSSVNPDQNPYLTRKDWGKIVGDDIPRTAQGDYDGDGKSDYAVYVQTEDPNDSPKFWILPSNGGESIVIPWGQYNWLPSYYNYPIASFNNR
jgi:hypothetical protein